MFGDKPIETSSDAIAGRHGRWLVTGWEDATRSQRRQWSSLSIGWKDKIKQCLQRLAPVRGSRSTDDILRAGEATLLITYYGRKFRKNQLESTNTPFGKIYP